MWSSSEAFRVCTRLHANSHQTLQQKAANTQSALKRSNIMTDSTQITIEAGAIWNRTDKNAKRFLSIVLKNKTLNGFQSKEKKTEKSPDFNLIEFKADGESALVGAAWIGETKSQREKLTLKIGDEYFTAVKRDVVEGQKEGRADYTIFNNEFSDLTEASIE
jgi:uncharacterized protein (DUF736 family)